MSVTPDSAFPIDIRSTSSTKPDCVIMSEAQRTDDRGRPTGEYLSMKTVQWDFISKNGQSYIRIINVPGLSAGKYKMKFMVVWEDE